MKQTIHSLLFALLFALVLVSIGLSVRPMLLLARQMPAPKAGSTLRLPAATPARYTGTPSPAAGLRNAQPAA
jgi:hypothetical protein